MAKKKTIKTKKQAIEYINKVLNGWSEFLEAHKPFEQALRILIKEESK